MRININADDLGLSTGTNYAIEKAHRKGVLTSASLMATGPAFSDGVKMAKRNPKLAVGIHLSLTVGRSILHLPLLVDDKNYFNQKYAQIILESLNNFFLKQIAKEFEAQIKKIIDSGIKPAHLDSQEHVHMIPSIFAITIALAKKYKINTIRVSKDNLELLAIKTFVQNLPPIENFAKFILLSFFYFLNRNNYRSRRKFFGVLYTGRMSRRILSNVVSRARNVSYPVEILSHPGTYDISKEKFDFKRQNLIPFLTSKNRRMELEALCH